MYMGVAKAETFKQIADFRLERLDVRIRVVDEGYAFGTDPAGHAFLSDEIRTARLNGFLQAQGFGQADALLDRLNAADQEGGEGEGVFVVAGILDRVAGTTLEGLGLQFLGLGTAFESEGPADIGVIGKPPAGQPGVTSAGVQP